MAKRVHSCGEMGPESPPEGAFLKKTYWDSQSDLEEAARGDATYLQHFCGDLL